MVDFEDDEWLRDVSIMIVGWIIALAVSGLLLIFVGSAIFG